MRKINYLKENWDYLLVLDACRFDIFSKVIADKPWEGKLEKVNSRVTFTKDWYRKHWTKPNDIHLITANPHPFLEGSGPASKNFKSATAAWQEDEVDPRVTLNFFKKIKKPGEKYLIHFIPPHLPFVGKKGKKLFKKLGIKSMATPDVYKKVVSYGRQGNWDELKECYRENLELVLDVIKDNWSLFADGKAIFTSDHGELLGEWGIYGHPPSRIMRHRRRILQTVPWFEIQNIRKI